MDVHEHAQFTRVSKSYSFIRPVPDTECMMMSNRGDWATEADILTTRRLPRELRESALTCSFQLFQTYMMENLGGCEPCTCILVASEGTQELGRNAYVLAAIYRTSEHEAEATKT